MLVEFAFVALLMILLVSVVLDFGRLFYSAQAAQDAVRAAARELSVVPLPADMSLEEALEDERVRSRVFQPEHLVIDLDAIPGGVDLQTFLDGLPVLNQTLRPLMIFDRVGGRRLLRYPGTLLVDPSTPSGLTVGIPFIEGRDADGVETIRWVPVLEEIRNPAFPNVSPFRLNTPEAMPERGLVAIRIHLPFQAAMLTGHLAAATPGEPNVGNPILAADGAVQHVNAPPGALLADDGGAGPYAGPLGLGRFYALGQEVRPWRKLLTVQAIFRREVFE